ncbi:chemotaxis protein CheB [Dactylosporangium sp. NPDC000521]|uniref:chemotaxis protein CheB n=1 Tax=Dactylosporangium sp. NPDC000521 TaxID=3363975 RepID=UPI00368737D0
MAAPRAVVVVGASAGGVEALRTLIAGLPADLPAAVCVTLHIPPTVASALPRILSRAGILPASHPPDGAPLLAGHVYVAPADRHLLVDGDHVRLSAGPPERGHRPAIDPLFRSAALHWGPLVAGAVLSGSGDDGTGGLAVVAARGGAAFAQAPQEAPFPRMPRSAAEHVPGCHVLPVARLAPALAAFAAAADPGAPRPDPAQTESHTESHTESPQPPQPVPGFPHLPAEVADALRVAVRSLEEKAGLSERMSATALRRGSAATAELYRQKGAEAARASALIRELIIRIGGTGP